MRQYVLRYRSEWSKGRKVRSERFPASNNQDALNYALEWVNKKNHDLIILWEEVYHPDSGVTPNGHYEMIDVYNPGSED